MTATLIPQRVSPTEFPLRSSSLEGMGMKFSSGGSHISRTMMLNELELVLNSVSDASPSHSYRDAILNQNVLGKTTGSTRHKSLRHLRELYALDPACPLFGLLRKLHAMHPASLPLLAFQVAWSRDPLLRATTPAVLDAEEDCLVETASLADCLEKAFPGQYSELNRNKVARNSASSWTQSGHLAGRVKKVRRKVQPSVMAVSMALFLGHSAGYEGAFAFSNPWCRLLDLSPERARSRGAEAHRAGIINLRSVGEVVELGFPLFAPF